MGSTGDLAEARKRCSEYMLKWDHSELTFPTCSAHELLGFVSFMKFPDRCQREVWALQRNLTCCLDHPERCACFFLIYSHYISSARWQLSLAKNAQVGLDGFLSSPTRSLGQQWHWLLVWEAPHQQVLEIPQVCNGSLQSFAAQNWTK